jgi:hypothetical protein
VTSPTPSIKLRSLYVARFLLEATGILLALFAIFTLFLAFSTPERFHGEHSPMKWNGARILLAAVGLLLPQVWAKLSSSLFLLGAGVWIFHTDAYRWNNLGIYPLFLAPLALTLWLRAGYNDFHIQRLPNGNWLP